MTIELIIDLISEVFYTVIIILIPILSVSLVIGIVISIFMAATSIQEMTLTFVPKIIITGIAIVVMLPFMADKMIAMTLKIFNMISMVL